MGKGAAVSDLAFIGETVNRFEVQLDSVAGEQLGTLLRRDPFLVILILDDRSIDAIRFKLQFRHEPPGGNRVLKEVNDSTLHAVPLAR